jgi:hypothetical protein
MVSKRDYSFPVVTGDEEVTVMADQKALCESISRRGVEGLREASARRQRTVMIVLVGLLLAVAAASLFVTGGDVQRPTTIDLSHNTHTR